MNLPTRVLVLTLATALPAASQAPSQPAPSPPPRIEVAESRKLVADGKAVMIDVRAAADYAANHIAGALSVPLDTVAERTDELKKGGKKVIAYCA
jgi:rhodanese-related sulfurtransferase